MATLDASNSTTGFDMSFAELVSVKEYMGFGGTFTGWYADDDRKGADYEDTVLFLYGSDITVDGANNNRPNGGTVNQINFNIDGTIAQAGLGAVDVFISVDAIPITSMVSDPGEDEQRAADIFWSAILSGNDTILAPKVGGLVFGDFYELRGEGAATDERTGGNDTISASAERAAVDRSPDGVGGGHALIGDAFETSYHYQDSVDYPAILHGGADLITQTGVPVYSMIGDVHLMQGGSIVYGGSDTIKSSVALDPLAEWPDPPSIIGDVEYGNGTVYGGGDSLTGSNSTWVADRIYGDVYLVGGLAVGGRDSISGRGGQDRIAGDFNGIADGTENVGGEDTIRGGDDADLIAGDALSLSPFKYSKLGLIGGADLIYGDDGNDVITGDVYRAYASTVTTVTGGKDTIYGGAGDDVIVGDVFKSGVIEGLSDNPTVTITGGADKLYGEAGDDSIRGDGGSDTLSGGSGKDSLDGGSGTDTADYSEKTKAVELKLNGSTSATVKVNGAAEDTIKNIERVVGGSAGDKLTGDAKANRLDGGAGDDSLSGGDGADTLIGGVGKDTLTGGAGADSFRFTVKPSSSNVDTVKSFAHNTDKLAMDDAIFAAVGDAVTSSEFRKGDGIITAQDDTDHIIYDTSTGRLYYDADGKGGAAAVQFAILDTKPTLDAGDFSVV